MKLVKFTTSMRPFNVGDTRLVSDDVAERMVAAGEVEPNPPNFPPDATGAAMSPVMPKKPPRGARQPYLTK